MSEKRITLDRTNLLRLAEVLSVTPVTAAPPGFMLGWSAAIDALRHVALEMPELYGDDGCPVVTSKPTGT